MSNEQLQAAQARVAANSAQDASDEQALKALEESGGLEAALESGLDAVDGKTTDAVAPMPAVQTKAAPEETIVPQEIEKAAESEGKPSADQGDEPKAEVKKSDPGAKRWKKILSERNAVKKEKEVALSEAEQANERADALEKELEALRANPSKEEEDAIEDLPESGDIDSRIEQVIARRERAKTERQQRLNSVLDEYPNAKEHVDKIEEVMQTHRSLSEEAAWLLVKGALGDEISSSKAMNSTDAGGHLSPSRLNPTSPTDMSTSAMEDYLQKEAASGRLQGV